MPTVTEMELLSKITTLKKQDGTTLYPRTVTDAVVDKEGRNLSDLISNLSISKEQQSSVIASIKEKMDIIELVVDSKVDLEEGKGLSSNDFTNDLKAKLMQLPTKEELDELLATSGGTVVEQIHTTVAEHQQKFETIEQTLVQDIAMEENKIVFKTMNNTIVNEIEFMTNEDSQAVLDSIFDSIGS